MSGFHRSNLYQEEEDEAGMIDFSGFLGGMPNEANPRMRQPREEPPKVTTRPRQASQAPPSSNASGTVGYVVNNPIPRLDTEPEDPHFAYALSPFYADDDGIGSPKMTAIIKSAGITSLVLLTMYKIGKKDVPTPYVTTAMYLGGAAYLHPTLGVNHGLLKIIPGQDHWLAKYPRYGTIGAVHLGGAVFFGSRIRRQFR